MSLILPQAPIESVASEAPPEVHLSKEELDRLAHLSMLLAQNDLWRAGAVLDAQAMTPYEDRTPGSRAAMRAGVRRVIQALHMLGYIETPAGK